MSKSGFTFYEFFAGGGMARMGLGRGWRCLFANDFSAKKAAAYRANFPPATDLVVQDIRKLTADDLPGQAMLAWASFPCQDLSLAGERRGLSGDRSGTFWPFWNLMVDLSSRGRRVPIIVLENVVGALTSRGGRDFSSIVERLADSGYRVGALVMDAALWVPQSRPRLFVVAVDRNVETPEHCLASQPNETWHTGAVRKAYDGISDAARSCWAWWSLPLPPQRSTTLMDVVEQKPTSVSWHSRQQTQSLVRMMSPLHRERLRQIQREGSLTVGTVYRRTRPDGEGAKVQRAEVRFDQVSGCLRTPAGGSSRQTLLVIHGESVRSRLLSSREAARLMGVPDNYELPTSYNDAYHLMGDGVAVPAVSWLSKKLLQPLAKAAQAIAASV